MNQPTYRFRQAALALGLSIACLLAPVVLPHHAYSDGGTALPPQGLYDDCAPSSSAAMLTNCENRLADMSNGGFSVVLNYSALYASPANLAAYAQFAADHNIKIIWPFHKEGWRNRSGTDRLSDYSDLAATCGCTNNAGLLAYVIGLVKNLPATWGYYLADEPQPGQHDAVKAFYQQVKALDATHPTMIMAVEDCGTNGAAIRPFADATDVLAADYYPVSRTDSCTVGSWANIAKGVQTIADSNGKAGTIMVPQAMSYAEYPDETWVCSPFPGCASYPTEAQLQQERDLILGNAHPLVILWYSYFINGTSAPISGQHWADVKAAAFAGGTPAPAPPATTPAQVVETSQLTLSAQSVAAGQTLVGTFTLQNQGGSSVTLPTVVVASRAPNGANADFPAAGPITLAPGQSYTLRAGRAFTPSDPIGAGWSAMASYQTQDGSWHEQKPTRLYVVTTP